jgi:hypothetical protein
MSKIFKNQGLLTIKLDCGIDPSVATVKKILYKKPDGTKGEWDVVTDTGNIIKFSPADDTIIDQKGTWRLQSYLVIGGKAGYGDVVDLVITDNLKK